MALPEVTEEPHFDRGSYRVSGKIFATVASDGLSVNLFVDEPEADAALGASSGAVSVLRWGKCRRGVTLELAPARTPVVRPLVSEAWRQHAPATLLTLGSARDPARGGSSSQGQKPGRGTRPALRGGRAHQ
jgi:YjbR